MIRNILGSIVTMSAVLLAVPTAAMAVNCKGANTSKVQPMELLHEKPDGSKIYFVRSDFISTVLEPAGTAYDGAKILCTGLRQVGPSGSPSSGHGTCYAYDGDGDTYFFDWSREAPDDGVWQIKSGTGKFANDTSSGTFKPNVHKYVDGFARNLWDGDCTTLK